MAEHKRLYVLDGTALLYRAHFAMINNPLMTGSGFITSGIFGFMTALARLLKSDSPDYLAVVFDDRAKTFRHAIYTEYKATREKMPDELAAQIEPLDQILKAMDIPLLRTPGFEADDIMGTLAVQAEARGWHTYLVTGDKDMMQLVSDHTSVHVPAYRNNPVKVYGRDEVEEKWGVPPDQMIDLLGLMGDSSDNVPGVPGVGAKTALKLILEYGSLEEALNHADEVKNKRAREGLQNGRELALLSKELVTIDCQVPLEINLDDLALELIRPEGALDLLKEYEIKAVVGDLLSLGAGAEPVNAGAQPVKRYATVLTKPQLDELRRSLDQAEWISFDVETTGLDPLRAELVGMSFSIAPDEGWYVPILYPDKPADSGLTLDEIIAAVGPILEDPQRP
ncbi:MAG: DNA polymerase I, partial [Candidatus Marinimicrobia bacterium]|nr:DNA polymerase I [Candidatus Neomarinimicrobiota bacterium]